MLGGIAYRNYFKKELSKPEPVFQGFATIIAPCRGLDDGLEDNLKALFEQDHSAFEVIFVVDDERDPALGVIEKLVAAHANSKLVIAPAAVGCGQKVANLREAVLHADPKGEVFVFVDSDARPSVGWLRHLTTAATGTNIGAATGYRWYLSKKPGLGSELRSAWNASIASALGPNSKSNFCWGGSMAIRRDVFENLAIRDRWAGAVSDDFVATRAIKDAGLEIAFVPQALTASIEGCTFGEMLEFTIRQMKITRVYAAPLWVVSVVGSALFNIVLASASLIAVFATDRGWPVYVSLFTLVAVGALSIAKSWLRWSAVRMALTEHRTALDRQFIPQHTLWLAAPAIFLINCIAAALSRRITWRGIT
jgi:cellulose synthase/poly-beta-1,6-N-acetylglucosamine synthase-like glycosyltransferase